MDKPLSSTSLSPICVGAHRRLPLAWLHMLWLVSATSLTGCAAFHPVRGVPAAYIPDDIHGESRNDMRPIDFSLLVRTPPDQHRVAAGDVLSIYVPGVLGRASVDFNSEVGVEPPINLSHSGDDPPTIGFPIQVRDDNTITLPQVGQINVHGLTLYEVEQAVRNSFTQQHKILQANATLPDMILVSLQRPREHRILVVRQETNTNLSSQGGGAGTVDLGSGRRGSARIVRLKAYENDVMHALSGTEGVDGLPGPDAVNVIYIIRRRGRAANCQNASELPQEMTASAHGMIRRTSGLESIPGDGQFVNPALYTETARNRAGSSVVLTGHSLVGSPAQSQSMRRTVPAAISQSPPQGQAGINGHSFRSASNQQLTPSPYQSPYTQYQHTYPSAHGTVAQPVSNTAYGQPRYSQPVSSVTPSQYQVQPYPQGVGHGSYGQQLPGDGTISMPVESSFGHSALEPTAEMDPQWFPSLEGFDPTIDSPDVVKIPIRLKPGEMPQFSEEDITLYDGDILFIDSRETEVFYTGGLLGGGQFTLPRDYDLRVLEALSIAEGRSSTGGGGALRSVGGVSALNQDVATSASRLVILRTLPNGQRVPIEVDINKAMRYQEENILIQPGDMLILQYTLPEATAAFVQRFLLEGALIGIATSSFTGSGGQ